jgi:hypothetical protein
LAWVARSDIPTPLYKSITAKKRKNPKTSILRRKYGISDRTGDYSVERAQPSPVTAVRREIVVRNGTDGAGKASFS